MRHLVALSEAGLLARVPTSVAELGPGDSIGVGLAGILSGVRSYVAVDAAVFVRGDPLEPLDELARMIRDRTPIPDVLEMPIGSPPLRSREFPLALIDPEASSPEAVAAIRERPDRFVRYVAPWTMSEIIPPDSVDLLISQAVMEHVSDVEAAYTAMAKWLRKGGIASHQVDFRSHGTALTWNGHWRYSRSVWRVANLRKSGINRLPLSAHLRALEAAGLEVVGHVDQIDTEGIDDGAVHDDWRHLSSADLRTASAWINARRT